MVPGTCHHGCIVIILGCQRYVWAMCNVGDRLELRPRVTVSARAGGGGPHEVNVLGVGWPDVSGTHSIDKSW